MWTPQALAKLEADELTDVLVDLGEHARRAAIDGKTDVLRRLRALLVEAGDLATGEASRLLAVAKAFVRDLGRVELSGRERALREFLRDHGDDANWAVERWLKELGVDGAQLAGRRGLELAMRRLVDRNVLREDRGVYWLTDEARAILSDLMEPMAFRLWREVERARRRIAELGANSLAAEELLVGRFAVDTEQARRYLVRYPIDSVQEADALVLARPKTTWQAARWLRASKPMPSPMPNERTDERRGVEIEAVLPLVDEENTTPLSPTHGTVQIETSPRLPLN
jgi:hypothetical protein